MYKKDTINLGMLKGYTYKFWLIMRLTTVILIASMMQVSAIGFAQKISLSKSNAPLKSVLKELKFQSGYVFLYTDNLLKLAKPVDIKVAGVDFEDVLKQVFEDQPLTYTINEHTITVKEKDIKFFDKLIARFQTLDIKGKVVDESGNPLPGTNVKIKGSDRNARTNEKGEFYLENVDDKAILVISFTGYQSREIPVAKDMGLIKLTLREDKLDEVEIMVNTGYQTLPKERATGSFTQINNELFNRSTSGNVLDRLEGITNGMLFTRKGLTKENLSGSPEIRVRGVNTILGSKSPLIVVDNFPYNGDINQLNPQDVESVTVLKDAAAASIWGALAGNGVIVINTKSGQYNQRTTVSFNSNIVLGDKPNLFYSQNYLPASTVMDLQKQMFDKGAYFRFDQQRLPLYPELLYKLQDNLITQEEFDAKDAWYRSNDLRKDWSNLLYQQSVSQQNALSVRGGGNNYRYTFTADYDHDKESYVGNSGSRLNLSLQNTFKITPNLELTGAIWYTNSPRKSNAVLSSITNSYNSVGPDIYERLVDENGNPNPINLTSYRYFYQEQIQKQYPDDNMADWLLRPLDEEKYNDSRSTSTDLRMNAGLKYKFLKYFSADVNFQYISSQVDQETYYAPESYYVRDLYNKFLQPGIDGPGTHPIPLGGILDHPGQQKATNQAGRGMLNYAQTFNGKHSINAIAGAEVRQYIIFNQPGVTLYDYNPDLLTAGPALDFSTYYFTLPAGYGSVPTSENFLLSHKTTRDLSYFGNASYTYNDKYILSGSMRWDGSNLLGVKTNQRGTALWSTGLAWDISKEPFFPLKNQVSYLKLRATYGSAGNIDRTQTQFPTIRDGAIDGNTQTTVANLVTAGNPSLRWEQVNTLNFGTDFSLFNSRINGSIEYYRKYASDLLGNSLVDPTTGVPPNFQRNYGAMQTWGWDIQIGSRNLEIGKFNWTSNLILNTSANKITRLNERIPGLDNQYLNSNINEAGMSVDKIYALPWNGLNPQNGSVLLYDANGAITTNYYDYYSAIKKSDLILAGVTVPKISASLMNTFEWNGLSVSALIVGRFDYVFRRTSMLPGGEFGNILTPGYHMDYFKRWKTPGDEKTTNVPAGVPAALSTFDVTYSGVYYQYSEALITKGDVIRLQDVTLSYTIPSGLMKKWPVKRLRVYGYARDIGILWRANKEGLDPDYPNTLYPQPKSYSFGIQADF